MSAVLVLSFQTTAQAIDDLMLGSDALLGPVVARTRSLKFDFARCAANWTSTANGSQRTGGCTLKAPFAAKKSYENLIGNLGPWYHYNLLPATYPVSLSVSVGLDGIIVRYDAFLTSIPGAPAFSNPTYADWETHIRAGIAELAKTSGSTTADVIHIQYQTVAPAATSTLSTTTTLAP